MGSALVRQWMLLATLPKPPRRVDAATIAARLAERGLDVHVRTIQRDLVELASVFPIVADDRTKPYGWRWSDEARFLWTVPIPPGGADTPGLEIVLRVRRLTERASLEALRARHTTTDRASADPGDHIVRTTVDDDRATRRTLLGFVDDVEVLEPASLRQEMIAAAERAARRYSK